MEPTQVHTLNLRGVLSVSKRIILSRYGHFVSLSLLLFFPLSFSLITLPQQPFTHLQLTAYLLVHVLALCAVGAITYSTHHAFFGEPLNFLDSLTSLNSSFFPLASTAIIAHVLVLLISLSLLVFVGIVLTLVHDVGYAIDYNSVYFMWFLAIMGAILVVIVVYFYVEWSLAYVVVVVESRWGYAALKRSSYLVKGMRSVSLLVMLYFGVCGVMFVWIYSEFIYNSLWLGYLVFMTMLDSFFLMMMLLRITAANAVLYNYCKALHGELELELEVHEYMNLPSDAGW